MDRRFDWTIDINVGDTNYLSYAGSRLSPITRLLVNYRLNPHFGGNAGKFIGYEELWYHKGQALGSKRLSDLNIPTTIQGGAIRVIPSPNAGHNVDAISGGIARLVLDVGLRRAVLDAVFIPAEVFQPVLNDLGRFNILPTAKFSPSAAPIELPFFSDPLGSSSIMYLCTDNK